MNSLTERLQLEPCAVGSAAGVAAVQVSVVTLDGYRESTGTLPDVLLVDIEGFEIAALAGASRLIRKRGGDLIIVGEMHPGVWDSANTTVAEAESLLRDLKLRVVPLTGQRDPLAEYGQVRLEAIG